jgi:hypothetical protein
LGCTCTSFEQSPAEFYTILLEEHLQVALEMLEVGICSSLVSKTDHSGLVVFKPGDLLVREDVEVRLHALQTMTEQLQLCVVNLSTYSLAVNSSMERVKRNEVKESLCFVA